MPKNIYGVSKTAAEDLCQLFHRGYQLPCLILRTSRFFLEEDDNPQLRQSYENANIKVNELLYRRVDLSDVVSAHLRAMEKAPMLGFGKYIISATTPFTTEDVIDLKKNAIGVVQAKCKEYKEIYAAKGWRMFPKIDRVYVNQRAREELGWSPQYDFQYVLESLAKGGDFCSPLARMIGVKGYHEQAFEEGPYPVSSR